MVLARGPELPSLGFLLPLGPFCAKPEPFLHLNFGGSVPAGRGKIDTPAKEQVIAFVHLLDRLSSHVPNPQAGAPPVLGPGGVSSPR